MVRRHLRAEGTSWNACVSACTRRWPLQLRLLELQAAEGTPAIVDLALSLKEEPPVLLVSRKSKRKTSIMFGFVAFLFFLSFWGGPLK